MFAKKTKLGAKLIEDACMVAGTRVSGDKTVMTMQYFCNGRNTPLDEHRSAILYKMILEDCERDLMYKHSKLSKEEADYVLIPTLMQLSCAWCPKNFFIYSPRSLAVVNFRLEKCESKVSRFVIEGAEKAPGGLQETEILDRKFYESFWAREENMKYLIAKA